ncbi:MAG: DNA methyltransferase [Pirellulales bacterium]
MNAVEIEEAVSTLAEAPFDPEAFPYAFLEAFGNKATTLKKLKKGDSNKSDLPGGVLQRNNIHIKVCPEGEVTASLEALRQSAATARHKAKFILATDGKSFEAENLVDGETVACAYSDFHDHFGFFLPLAGITTVKQIRENAFDIKATGRLNKLYVELLRENPDWDTAARREDLNHFFARLIFCFFAEDTNIFYSPTLFTATVDQMSARDSSNTHEVISELFRAMNTPMNERDAAKIRSWAIPFPYVNGGLFSRSLDVPRFSKIARPYLLHIGRLDWKKINPDIFGSMIQAVADDEERGALGLHYTSVPNILKVLNPLFLDDLRAKLAEAGDGGSVGGARKLLNLRNRIARIRLFDPACGSGNFLVIGYKEMREIEAEINRRRGEADRASEIPINNFRGIELRHFAVEIARLALIIADYQCDVLYRGPKLALAEFLPLEKANWITCGNALQIDWLSVCPPTGTGVKVRGDDLFSTPLDQAEIDFENEGGETYICGNPPYLGSRWLTTDHKEDLEATFAGRISGWKSLDYVAGWFLKAADYGTKTDAATAFVSTNSICQGQQVPALWPAIFSTGHEIFFAHTSFKWANLASHNAGVIVVIVGISNHAGKLRRLFASSEDGTAVAKETANINAYLIAAPNVEVTARTKVLTDRADMRFGNHPYYGGSLIFSEDAARQIIRATPAASRFIRPLYGSKEFISAVPRACLWISKEEVDAARSIPAIAQRLSEVAVTRRAAKQDKAAQKLAETPYRFRDQFAATSHTLVVPRVSSVNRPFLPVGLLSAHAVIQDQAFALYDAALWNMSLIVSRVHLVWIGTVCGKMKTDYRYSNTLGWNTFPVPTLTDQNKADLTRCAEDILLAREAHFPATIADLYDPDTMPANLREAHERNDLALERIYIGRRFKNDTERLEKLFELYTEMTARQAGEKPKGAKKGAKRKAKGGDA